MNFKDFLFEGVADTHLQNKFHFKPDFSDFEDEYKKSKSKEDDDKIIYNKKDINGKFVIIKNPKSLKNIHNDARGVIDKEGNLYLQQFNLYKHSYILQILNDLNLINNDDEYWWVEVPIDFVTIQRYKNTNKF